MRPSFVIGALAVFGACKNASVRLEDVDTEALRARCERFTRCGLFTDQDACEAYFRIVVDVNRQPAIDAGLVRYDGEAARRCDDAIAAMTCDGTSREARVPPADCAKIFVGTVADGDACQDDTECASARCNRDFSQCDAQACCMGTCANTQRSAVGDQCNDTRDCVADTSCGQDHLCHALGGVGADCFVDNQCDYGLGCTGTSFPKTCTKAATLGNTCPDKLCAEIGSVCNAAGTCVAAGLPGGSAACASDVDCSIYALCDLTSHLCVGFPTLGMACDAHGCAGNAYCDLTVVPGVCRDPLASKSPCVTDLDCASDFCYDGPVFEECEDRKVCI
jgi:hypothetical protein